MLFALILGGLLLYAIQSGAIRSPERHEALGGGLALLALLLAGRGSLLIAGLAGAAGAAVYLAGDAAARRGAEQEARALSVLGLPPGADEAAIRAAHRRLSAVTHPDRGGTHLAQQELNAARDLLLRRRKNAMR